MDETGGGERWESCDARKQEAEEKKFFFSNEQGKKLVEFFIPKITLKIKQFCLRYKFQRNCCRRFENSENSYN